MTWGDDKHPNAVALDAEDTQPPIIGSRWQARTPEDWSPWNLIEVCAFVPLPEGQGELAIRPIDAGFGEPVVSASVDSLFENYRRVRDENEKNPAEEAIARLRERVQALEQF